MPIYEYESTDAGKGCEECRPGFEFFQRIDETPLSHCPHCGRKVRKIISWCRAAVVETSEAQEQVDRKITEYERQGMWSHAAELADSHSEKTKDKGMKMRALDDYQKAGYDVGTLEKHSKQDNNG